MTQEEIKGVYLAVLEEFVKNDTNEDGYAEDRKCIYNQIEGIEHNDDGIDVKLFIYHISQFAILLGYGYKGLEDELSNRLGVKCVISVRQKAI